METIKYIPDLLVRTENGQVATEAWVFGPLRDALFVVTKTTAANPAHPNPDLYTVTHMPTGLRMPEVYADKEQALTVCRQLTDLLADVYEWWGWQFHLDLSQWLKVNPDMRRKIQTIRHQFDATPD